MISTISSKEVDVKKWGIKYKEGDRISFPTMNLDIKLIIVTWHKIVLMTLECCRPVIKTQFIYSARKSGNHLLSLQNKVFSVDQRKMYQ